MSTTSVGPARIAATFDRLRAQGRAALIPFLIGGDPDLETSFQLLSGLPAAGADVIEIGMPFTDPMADGPAIQVAARRALAAGQTLAGTLAMVRRFRDAGHTDTPVVLMGYANPILTYGIDRFVVDAAAAGVDGLIVVDLPPEEEAELGEPARAKGLAMVRLVTPTTDAARLKTILSEASGFLYYVSVTGITGVASASATAVADALAAIRSQSPLPVAVGFGIDNPAKAAAMAQHADAVVVGSALVRTLAGRLDQNGKAQPALVDAVLAHVAALADGVCAGRAG